MTDIQRRSFAILFISVFIYAMIGMIVSREFVIPYMTGSTDGTLPGDAQYYENLAEKKVDDIQSHGLEMFELRPAGQGPAGIASAFYLIWNNPYFIVWCNALLHAFSVLAMAAILLRWFSLRISFIAVIPLAISPYMLFWFSQLNKDSFVLSGALFFILGLLKLTERAVLNLTRHMVLALLPIVLGIALIWVMRPYVNQLMLPITILVLLVIFLEKIRFGFGKDLIAFVFCSLVILVALTGMTKGAASDATLDSLHHSAGETLLIDTTLARCLQTTEAGKWQDAEILPSFVNNRLKALMAQRCLIFSLMDIHDNVTTLDSFFDIDRFPSGSIDAIAYLPRAVLFGIFSPLPDRWDYIFDHGRSTFYLIAPIEAVILYIGLIFICIWLVRSRNWSALIPITLSMFAMTVYAMATPFLGALYRYRYPWWMMLICLGIAALLQIAGRKKCTNDITIK